MSDTSVVSGNESETDIKKPQVKTSEALKTKPCRALHVNCPENKKCGIPTRWPPLPDTVPRSPQTCGKASAELGALCHKNNSCMDPCASPNASSNCPPPQYPIPGSPPCPPASSCEPCCIVPTCSPITCCPPPTVCRSSFPAPTKLPPPCYPSPPVCVPRSCSPAPCCAPLPRCSPSPCCPPSPYCPPSPCCPPACPSPCDPCVPPACPSPCDPCVPPACPSLCGPCVPPPTLKVCGSPIPPPCYPFTCYPPSCCPADPEIERPRNYEESISGDESWRKAGIRIASTDPPVPGDSILVTFQPIFLTLTVEAKETEDIQPECLGAYCWTHIITADNPCGVWKDMRMSYDPWSSEPCATPVQKFVFRGCITPVSCNNCRLTFNVKYGCSMIWANDWQIDNLQLPACCEYD